MESEGNEIEKLINLENAFQFIQKNTTRTWYNFNYLKVYNE